MGVWIEMTLTGSAFETVVVTPLVGVWIEISFKLSKKSCGVASLPLWECGLKYIGCCNFSYSIFVTPLVGVWIEILYSALTVFGVTVTPLVGVWIEITNPVFYYLATLVTPLGGVWIEMTSGEVQQS